MSSVSLTRLLVACWAIALSSSARAAQPAPLADTTTSSSKPSVVAASPIGHALTRADLEAWVDGYMPYALERGDIAGAVVAIVKDGEVLMEKGYGYADVDRRTPVDAQKTLFRVGSVAKLFTFTAVMQEVEQRKVELDRDINDYLDFKIPDRNDGPITVRHLLTHTAGFEEQHRGAWVDRAEDLVPLETYVRRSAPVRIFKAGTTPAYSNYGASLAGYVVQRVSGQAFDDYIETHLFRPLGMMHSTFRQPLPASLAADVSSAYNLASEPAKPYELIVPAPAGSLAASGADLAKFMIAHLEGGAYLGARLLMSETAKIMHETPAATIPPLNRMMLGFYEQNYNGHRVISHGGDTAFMHSYLHLLVDDHVGLFVSLNSTGRDRTAGAIRSALFEQFLDRYFPGEAPAESSVDTPTAASHAKLVAGYYESSRRSETSFVRIGNLFGSMKVEADKEGTISFPRVKGRNGAVRHYREIEPFVWRDTRGGWRAAALVENGRVSRWSVDEVAPFMVFEPSPWWRSGAWLPLAAAFSAAANLLTALVWPIAAIMRRRRHIAVLVGRQAQGQLVSRIAAAILAAVSVAWLVLVVAVDEKFSLLGPRLDPWLWALSTLSVVAYLGGAGAMMWSSHTAWRTERPWPARIWTTTLALSSIVLLHTAYIHRLMSFSARY